MENLLVCFTSEYVEFMLVKFSSGCNVKKQKLILEILFSAPLVKIFTDNSVYQFFSLTETSQWMQIHKTTDESEKLLYKSHHYFMF